MALLLGVDNRNQIIRGKVSSFLTELVLTVSDELHGSKELDSLLLKLSKLTQDSSPEARMNSREIIRLMITKGLITRKHMESVLSVDMVEKSLAPQPSPKISTLTSPLHRRKQQLGSTRRASPHGSTLKSNNSFNTQSFSNGELDNTYTPTNNSSTPLNSSDRLQVEQDSDLVVAGTSPRGSVRDTNEGTLKKGIAGRRKVNGSTPKAASSMSQTKKMSQNAQNCVPELVELPLLLLVSISFHIICYHLSF